MIPLSLLLFLVIVYLLVRSFIVSVHIDPCLCMLNNEQLNIRDLWLVRIFTSFAPAK